MQVSTARTCAFLIPSEAWGWCPGNHWRFHVTHLQGMQGTGSSDPREIIRGVSKAGGNTGKSAQAHKTSATMRRTMAICRMWDETGFSARGCGGNLIFPRIHGSRRKRSLAQLFTGLIIFSRFPCLQTFLCQLQHFPPFNLSMPPNKAKGHDPENKSSQNQPKFDLKILSTPIPPLVEIVAQGKTLFVFWLGWHLLLNPSFTLPHNCHKTNSPIHFLSFFPQYTVNRF